MHGVWNILDYYMRNFVVSCEAFLQLTVNHFSIEMKVRICINTTTAHLP